MALVQVKVYNTLVKEVTALLNKYMKARNYEVEFDGSNLPSGTYFYRRTAHQINSGKIGDFRETNKMILMNK